MKDGEENKHGEEDGGGGGRQGTPARWCCSQVADPLCRLSPCVVDRCGVGRRSRVYVGLGRW